MNMGVFEPLTSSVWPTLQHSFLLHSGSEITATSLIQTVGETSLAGILGIAGLQGALILKQYANNPCGGLIVPPGLTQGNEDDSRTNGATSDIESIQETNNPAFARSLKASPLSDADLEAMVCDASDNTVTCALKKQWYHVVTKAMAIAVFPLALFAGPSWGVAAWMLQWGHLVHLAVIFGLTHIYDFFRKMPTMDGFGADVLHQEMEEAPIFQGENPRVLVLGDSMSVGIGSCEVFDDHKVYDIPLHKEEHLADTAEHLTLSKKLPGPIFPQVLARTLSKRFQKPVAWRSAGVDGGATQDIAEHLMNVVQDEVDKGQAPDLVVVLTGSNDLKHILDGSASVKGFRSNLADLAKEIRTISPNTRVVYPALPTYRIDQKSVLNVFPLSVCLDSIMGLWDAQKMTVADQYPGVMHVDLTVKDVSNWYQPEDDIRQRDEPISLIAADGIHPNARCYSKWGAFVGNDLADQILKERDNPIVKIRQGAHPQHRPAFVGGDHHVPATAFSASLKQQKQEQ